MTVDIEIKKRSANELVQEVNDKIKDGIAELERIKKAIQDNKYEFNYEDDPETIDMILEDTRNVLSFALFHKRYGFPNTMEIDPDDYASLDEIEKEVAKRCVVYSRIYMLDHSEFHFSTTPFRDPWDSGCIGFVGITKDKVKEIHGKYTKDLAQKTFDSTLKEWLAAMNGDRYLVGIRKYGIWVPSGTDITPSETREVLELIDEKIAELKEGLVK
jgi:hypothetical protein